MLKRIQQAIDKIEVLSKEKEIKVVSHFDTDGITSAAIFARVLERWNKNFSLEVVKSLDEEFIKSLPEDKIIIFLDLASGSLDYLKEKKTEIIVFDHHEIDKNIPDNVFMVNSMLEECEPLSCAAICYLFAKILSEKNKDLAKLAVIGMVGDLHEKNIGKIFSEILSDSESTIKKGLLLYPSTRPLDKALEYSSSPFIPGVTGSYKGVMELLRDSGIENEGGRFKALYELSDEEMQKLITAVVLRCSKSSDVEKIIGNLFLIKFFNKLEDSRELSALINACSRMGKSSVALGFCLGNKNFKDSAEKIYLKYKQSLVSALKFVNENMNMNLSGKNYMIINGKDQIKDTIIGTVASIMSHSPVYSEGLIIIALAYDDKRIKVSARIKGKNGRNVREILSKVVVPLGGEVGGHACAAGCLISRENEEEFISGIKKILEIDLVKV